MYKIVRRIGNELFSLSTTLPKEYLVKYSTEVHVSGINDSKLFVFRTKYDAELYRTFYVETDLEVWFCVAANPRQAAYIATAKYADKYWDKLKTGVAMMSLYGEFEFGSIKSPALLAPVGTYLVDSVRLTRRES